MNTFMPSIQDRWNPTESELQAMFDAALPVDHGFVDRVFNLARKSASSSPEILNLMFEFQEKFEKTLPLSIAESLSLQIDGYDRAINE